LKPKHTFLLECVELGKERNKEYHHGYPNEHPEYFKTSTN